MKHLDQNTREPRLSVWAECQCAGMLVRLMVRDGIGGDVVQALAAHVGWSRSKTTGRLGIAHGIPPMVLHLASVRDHQMERLPLARLLDIARKRNLCDKAICLSYAIYGRRPGWADRR